MSKIAACVFTCYRPNYLKYALRAYERMVDLDSVDWYLFQDGAIMENGQKRKEPANVDANLKVLEDNNIPNSHLVVNSYNVDMPIQMLDACERLFDKKKYDALIWFTDDFIVSKYYLRVLNKMYEQFPYSVGKAYCYYPDSSRNLDEVWVRHSGTWLGSYFPRECYELIEKEIEIYRDLITDNNGLPLDRKVYPLQEIRKKLRTTARGLDAMMGQNLNRKGIMKMITPRNRALYIGVWGDRGHIGSWKRKKRNLQEKNFEHEEDANIGELRLTKDVRSWKTYNKRYEEYDNFLKKVGIK